MEELIEYLSLKNRYYEKFYSISTKFLEQANKDKWDELSFFVENRERLLNLIRAVDAKVAKALRDRPLTEKETAELRPRIRELMSQRKSIGEKIVSLDLQLISKIDSMKSDTIRDLKKTLETNQQLEAFERVTPTKRVKARNI